MTAIRVLGIDPGLGRTGYAVLEFQQRRPKLVEAGVIRGRQGTLEQRLQRLYQGLEDVLITHQPEVLALEELYSHYRQPKTSILMGHARGVICLAAAQAGTAVQNFPATNVKKLITGNGRASKEQMQLAVQQELGLDRLPEPHDMADALAIALCCGFLSSSPVAPVNGLASSAISLPEIPFAPKD